eukprot:COSAG01_NODE_2651_length_7304_cov_6.982799_3_plen_99_part_00
MHRCRLPLINSLPGSAPLSHAWRRERGGEEEIAVLAGVLGVTMVVHDMSRGHKLEYVPEKKAATSTVHLRYTRNEEAVLVSGDLEAGGHYDLFVDDQC